MDATLLKARLAERQRLGMGAAQFENYVRLSVVELRVERSNLIQQGIMKVATSNDARSESDALEDQLDELEETLREAEMYATRYGVKVAV